MLTYTILPTEADVQHLIDNDYYYQDNNVSAPSFSNGQDGLLEKKVYENGLIRHRAFENYARQLHGPAVYYHEDGVTEKKKGNFHEGRRVGKWIFKSKDGSVIKEKTYPDATLPSSSSSSSSRFARATTVTTTTTTTTTVVSFPNHNINNHLPDDTICDQTYHCAKKRRVSSPRPVVIVFKK